VEGTLDASAEPLLDSGADEAVDSVCGDVSGISIPSGVDVRGLAQPPVVISVRGRHGLCARGSNFSKIAFERAALKGPLLEFDGGSAELRGVSFQNFDGDTSTEAGLPVHSLFLRGQSAVEWIAEPPEQTLGQGALASLQNNARLHVVAGQGRLFPPSGITGQVLFRATNASVLQLSGVTLRGDPQQALGAVLAFSEDPQAVPSVSFADGTLVEGFAVACRFARSAQVSVTDSEFRAQGTMAVLGIPSVGADQASVRIERSTIRNAPAGLFVIGQKVSIHILDSLFEGNDRGIVASVAGPVTILDSRVIDNTGVGISASAESGVMRRTSVERNGIGVLIGSQAWDLGTANDPGQNHFSSNGQLPTTSLSLNCNQGCLVNASGNTWDPLQQGADGDGHYAASASGALDVTEGAGPNYVIYSGTLRLAE
jgi:hypothetical protein